MEETTKAVAKATEEVAKTAGKAIDAGRDAGGFLAEIIRPLLAETAGLFTDKIKVRRIENALDMRERVVNKIAALGSRYSSRELPLAISIPFIEAVSLEDSDNVRELWANLATRFTNAQSEVSPNKAFVSVLREMSSLDGLIFQKIYSTPLADERCIVTAQLPDLVQFEETQQSATRKEPAMPTTDVEIAIANLFRLQCLQTAKYMGGPDVFSTVYTTTFGRALFCACSDAVNP